MNPPKTERNKAIARAVIDGAHSADIATIAGVGRKQVNDIVRRYSPDHRSPYRRRWSHGLTGYQKKGCRCDVCRRGWRERQRVYRRRYQRRTLLVRLVSVIRCRQQKVSEADRPLGGAEDAA